MNFVAVRSHPATHRNLIVNFVKNWEKIMKHSMEFTYSIEGKDNIEVIFHHARGVHVPII
jgi:hypothetical protein